jgi:pre-rRNA-processing protein TSR3
VKGSGDGVDLDVLVIDYGQDDPAKCTAKKMVRLGLATEVSRKFHASDSIVVLNPFARRTLSPTDRGAKGILVVDCSWTRAEEVFFRRLGGKHRRLPVLLASNPTNYAKPATLSSLEALAASLYILGMTDEARRYLSIYKWGETFEKLNHEPLEAYRKARSEAKVLSREREYFPHLFGI